MPPTEPRTIQQNIALIASCLHEQKTIAMALATLAASEFHSKAQADDARQKLNAHARQLADHTQAISDAFAQLTRPSAVPSTDL